MSRYKSVDSLYSKLISKTSNQQTLIDFEDKVHSNKSCGYIISFFMKNKDLVDMSIFTSLTNIDQLTITNNCKIIGKGYNEKGMDEAIKSLLNFVENKYKDFNNNKNRTEEFNSNIFL